MKTQIQTLFLGIIILLLAACKDNEESMPSTKPLEKTINGYVQKGPFVIGSSVTIYDLTPDFIATGKSYNCQIVDNKGTFKIDNIALSSNYVKLMADGFYFNEVSGSQSAAPIKLYALVDVSDTNKINVNVLTHLEKPRVEVLLSQGKSFAEAKSQAQREVLAVFNINKASLCSSEKLSLTQVGENNSILLAVSSILQGFRTESQLTELLNSISEDLKTDGVLSNATLGESLYSQALYLDTTQIKSNIVKLYNDMGTNIIVPSFGTYLTNFIANTKYANRNLAITYPSQGLYGPNLLSLTDSVYTFSTTQYQSLNAHLPKPILLKVKITSLGDSVYDSGRDTVPPYYKLVYPNWYYVMGSSINWTITDFDPIAHTQTYTANLSDADCDLRITLERGRYLIEYFENNSSSVTRRKYIKVN